MTSRLFTDREGDVGLPGSERRLAVLALVLGTSMAVIDATMINVALPRIAEDLAVTGSQVVWVTNVFQVVCAAFLLVFAGLSELFSRRRMYTFGMTLFSLAAVGAALSSRLETLLLFRGLQGLGAAATLSIGTSLYRAIFPSRLLGSALGLSAMVVAVGYAAGPAVGGLVLSVANWPWLFMLTVPLGLVAAWLAWRALPKEPRRQGGFDVLGALCAIITLSAFFAALEALSHGVWRLPVLLWPLLAILSFIVFLWRQRRAPHPLLHLPLFGVARFRLALASQCLAFIGHGVAFVALSFLFQESMGMTPLQTAWLFTPWPLTVMVVGPLAGRLADRLNPGLLASMGLGLLLSGLVALAQLSDGASMLDIVWRMALCGIGFGLFQSPNNRELMGCVSRERSANASGIMGTTRTVAQSLGVAVVGAFLATELPVQAALWLGSVSCFLALLVSLRRLPLAKEQARAPAKQVQ
ncbi:MFS transporter [Halomonas halocynthiae]|uniref:MFS transporter n=1 Tax=Halomonas halocynthiae TaxID=176290 RepID=UPI00041B2B81|nr:MFS transporter [Halomonas halocynthiae]